MEQQELNNTKFFELLKRFEPNRGELAKAMIVDRSFYSKLEAGKMQLNAERLIAARKYFMEQFNYDIRIDFPDIPQDFPRHMDVQEQNVKYENESYRYKYEQSLERQISFIMKELDMITNLNKNLIIQNDILQKMLAKIA